MRVAGAERNLTRPEMLAVHRLLALACVRAAKGHLDRMADMTDHHAETADVEAADGLDSVEILLQRWPE